MQKLKIIFISILILIISINLLNSQEELISAKALLEKLSEIFKTNTKDLKADIKLIQGNVTWAGTLLFKNPQKVRIDFKDPEKQVICSNGYELWVYIPNLNIVLHQDILQKERLKIEDEGNENSKVKTNSNPNENIPDVSINPILLNPVGLDRFISDYSVEYSETKGKIDYKDNTKVYQLKLIRWRSSRSGFNIINLLIQENGVIRQVKGITANYKQVILELDRVELNTNIGDLKFNYEAPAHTTTIDDFINK